MTDETPGDPARARSPTQRSRAASPAAPGPSNDPVQSRAAQLEAIVSQACRDNIDGATVQAQLRALGATAEEAEDTLDQIIQQRERETGPDVPPGEPTGDDSNTIDAVAWALFQGKLDAARQISSRRISTQDFLRSFLGSKTPSSSTATGIPASVLAEAPFLSKLDSTTSSDPHLAATLRLRKAYRTEKATDSIIDAVEGNTSLEEPISRAMWKDILADRYVNFEKLLGELEYGFDREDNSKELFGEVVLSKREGSSRKKPVQTEADWLRVMSVWSSAVSLVYPHRASELTGYKKIITEIFRACPNDPDAAIGVDRMARERYYQSPYHLDHRDQLNLPIMHHLHTSHSKRARNFTSGGRPAKRAETICENWNLNRCDSPCSNRRRHGICSECGKPHRAYDVADCIGSLLRRRKDQGAVGSSKPSDGGFGRPSSSVREAKGK